MSRRSWGREIGNPLTMFHGQGKARNVKWSMFRVILFGLWIGFLTHWPASPWGPWDWAAFATLSLAITVDTLFALAPVSEGLAALASIFGGAVGKRIAAAKETADQAHEWASGKPDEGTL